MFTVKSKFTGIDYAPNKCVFIKNPLQAALYYIHGASLCDLTVDPQDKKWVFVFVQEGTHDLYRKWNAHELK